MTSPYDGVQIGDVTRFPAPQHLCSWAGLTPVTASPT